MKSGLLPFWFIGALFLGGCVAPTAEIQQGKNLSASGIAYANAVDSLLDVTVDKVIEFDNTVSEKVRYGTDPTKIINDRNTAITAQIAQIEQYRAHTKVLKVYFLNLQALADSNVKGDAGTAVQSLGESINDINQALNKPDSPAKLSADQITQISALGGIVANAALADRLKVALTRDAKIIGTFLSLQENQLANITSILKRRFDATNNQFLQQKVVIPYADTANPLPPDWAANRTEWLKSHFINQQLDTATQAAKQLRIVWQSILEGKEDLGSLSLLLSDVNEFVTTVQALKTANEANKPTTSP